MDEIVYQHFESMQQENYARIYKDERLERPYYDVIKPMMEKLYERLLHDVKNNNYASPIFKHHLNHRILGNAYRD